MCYVSQHPGCNILITKITTMRILVLVYIAVCFVNEIHCWGLAPEDTSEFRQMLFDRLGELSTISRGQYAAILLLSQDQVNSPETFKFEPRTSNGKPEIRSMQDVSPGDPVNYLVARPYGKTTHAEEYLLIGLDRLWNNYRSKYDSSPAMLVIFSKIFPCTKTTPGETHDCLGQIADTFEKFPYRTAERILVYDSSAYCAAKSAAPEYDREVRDFTSRIGKKPLHLNFNRFSEEL